MNVETQFSPIAAVSTPRGRGGVAMVRISGDGTAEILERVFRPAGKNSPASTPRNMIYGTIVDGDTVLDTGMAVFFRAPASFTGEDMAEIYCHGGTLVTSRVLGAALTAGASPAGPGEFTKRAFLSGKLTLSEAESIGMLIDADTDAKMTLASAGTRGVLSEKIAQVGDSVSSVLSALFAVIDYPDEDIDPVSAERLAATLRDAASEASRLAATYRTGRAVAEGVRTLICGRPNVGKSSLYNALLGEDRAIVTSVAGTTRDVLEDTASVGGVTLRLSDTAGIRETSDEVEKIGVSRALEALDSCELTLAVYDGSSPLTGEDRRLIDEINGRGKASAAIAVINKADAGDGLAPADAALIEGSHAVTVRVSAKTGDGIDALAEAVAHLYGTDAIDLSQDAVVWDEARRADLERAAVLLSSAADTIENGGPEDASASDAELALAALRRTDGRGVSEEIVQGIFSHFCVGK